MPGFRIRAIPLLALALVATPAHAIETPRYTVERTLADVIEVRRYDPMPIAETTVSTADFRRAGNAAFRVLANHSFGDHQGRRDMAMTAIAMTAPVERRATDAGWTASFMMPAEWHRDSLPLPNDARVVIRETPERRIAAIRLVGTWAAGAYAARPAEGLHAVTRAGLVIVEITLVKHPQGRAVACQLRLDHDRYIPGYQELAEAIQLHGAKVFAQIHHAGRQAGDTEGEELVAPSAIPCGFLRKPVRALTSEEIWDLVNYIYSLRGAQ